MDTEAKGQLPPMRFRKVVTLSALTKDGLPAFVEIRPWPASTSLMEAEVFCPMPKGCSLVEADGVPVLVVYGPAKHRVATLGRDDVRVRALGSPGARLDDLSRRSTFEVMDSRVETLASGM